MKIFFVRHGVTQGNIDGTWHDDTMPITKHGMQQAKETGKALSKYGTFDLIICSPYLRTKQTMELINKELNVKKILYNDLIIEYPSKLTKYFLNEKLSDISNVFNNILNNKELLPKNKDLLTKASKYVDIKDMIKYDKLDKLQKETTNPFELNELKKNIETARCKMINEIKPEKVYKNDMKFLKYLKTLKNKCILVVSHGKTLTRLVKIITNTGNNDIKLIDKSAIKEDYKYYGILNCSIMACLYENKDLKLIIPPNILHLKKLAVKSPDSFPEIKHKF